MAQKLFVKTTDDQGKTAVKEVHVIRSWQESSGVQIYLHMNGTYGYKDESPVRDVKELDIIGDPIQKKAALAWWKRAGQQLSQEYYEKQEAIIEERLKRELPTSKGDDSNLDAVQYVRRTLSDRRKNAWSDPSTWFEWFDNRPEWWGFAGLIEIGNHRYKKLDETDNETEPDEKELEDPDDETGPGKKVSENPDDTTGPEPAATF